MPDSSMFGSALMLQTFTQVNNIEKNEQKKGERKENRKRFHSNKQKCKELKQTITVGLKTQYHSDITEPDGDEIDN